MRWPLLLLAALPACSTVERAPGGEAAYAVIPAADPAATPATEHRLGPGDVVRVTIYHEPDLSLEDARLSASGAIRMPLVGDVDVAGLTAGEAADRLAQRLGERYLVSPQVTLFVKQAVGQRITLDGEVRRPGLYPVDGALTLSQAVALGQGPSRLASLDQVVVVRRVDGERRAARFDLGAIRRGAAPDPEILPGDSIILGLSRAKAVLGGTILALPALAAGFIALDGND